MSDVLLELTGVEKRYGAVTAVERFDLAIGRGEFVAIMGPSGCGKTTTLRMLAGLETPTAGEIRLDGTRINELPVWERDTPLVWQSLALFPFLTVLENVEFGLRMRGVDVRTRRQKAQTWLDRLGIGDYANRDVATLSGGQRQRVALARSLITEPKVLLLDEPLSALDAHMSIRMQGVLKKLQRELGITFVYVTHSHSEAFALADRVVIMNRGQIEQIGAPKQIFLNPASRFVANFVGGINLFEGQVCDFASDQVIVDTRDGRFRVAQDGAQILAKGDIVDVAVRADRVSLTTHTGWAVNEVSCAFLSEEFVGAVVNLYLDSASGTEIVAQLQQRDLEQLEVSAGTHLMASWHPEDCRIIPRSRHVKSLDPTKVRSTARVAA
jgi:spermidine/putrescine transport system ATP-binding protein